MARIRVTVNLDEAIWRRFQIACQILNEYPSRGLDALMLAWLLANEAETYRHLHTDPPTG